MDETLGKVRTTAMRVLLYTLIFVICVTALLIYEDKLPSSAFTEGIIPGLLLLLVIAIRAIFRR